MRLSGQLLAVLVVFSAVGAGVSAGLEPSTPRAELAARVEERAVAPGDGGQTVISALTDVFTTFGDVATALFKVKLTPDTTTQVGRGKMGKMVLPLILGFKIAGAMIAAIVALKVLVLKTMAMSSLALLASAGVAGKYIYDKVQQGKHEHEVHESVPTAAAFSQPYYYQPVQEMTWDTSYDVASAHSDLTSAHQPPDLQGHYSNQVYQTAPYNQPYNQTAYSYIPGVPGT